MKLHAMTTRPAMARHCRTWSRYALAVFVGAIASLQISCCLAVGGPSAAPETNLALNRAAYHSSARDFDHTGHLATDGIAETEWISKMGGTQWIYVDLGAVSPVRRVRLQWGAEWAREFQIQTSTDSGPPSRWTNVATRDNSRGGVEDIPLAPCLVRYVRLFAAGLDPTAGISLREFEIYGKRSSPPLTPREPKVQADGRLYLTGGRWKLRSAAFVSASADRISRIGFDDVDWIPAAVPGTVLASYLKIGAIPDPRYGDQQFQISDAFFTNNDFWYRDVFTIPRDYVGKTVWLNFDGINWKADVYVNGSTVGHINGAFIRGRFDISAYCKPGREACVAVLVHKVAHPGKINLKTLAHMDHNGGVLGLDSPTFVSSIGWNWMPTIRGRNTGIWNAVYLDATGPVSIIDPFVITDLPLPDLSRADLTVKVELSNHTAAPQQGNLKGTVGTVSFDQPVTLNALETREIVLTPSTQPGLSLRNPRLWWPNGYGDQPLYTLTLRFEKGQSSPELSVSDQKTIRFGIRKLSTEVRAGVLTFFVNGCKILCRGGNWGMDDGMLMCDAQGFDTRVRLHKEMNLNMIRNWVGMTAGEGFYDACDRYGILIWDDFWLANPADGPDPEDDEMFLANARDRIRTTRSHPSLALYCGRNEGSPPEVLDAGLRTAVEQLDGTRPYIPDSASGTVTGHGPYEVQSPDWYFQNKGRTLHSELGIVCVPPVESMREMLPEEKLWPINDLWGQHDLHPPRGPRYVERVNQLYGEATGIDDFCRKAQMVNMETGKAMIEAWQSKQGSGGLIWMTQSAWPCLICQLYDYYFEPTAAYFGVKKASEPLHILWDSSRDEIKVANDTPRAAAGLSAMAEIYGSDSHLKWRRRVDVSVPSASAVTCFSLARPADPSGIYFLKLKLIRDGAILSDNFYWASRPANQYTDLEKLPKARLAGIATRFAAGSRSVITAAISNPGPTLALMVRLKLVGAHSGRRILPAFYDDNYFSLLPGETRTVHIEFDATALGGDPPQLIAEGWNVEKGEIPIR